MQLINKIVNTVMELKLAVLKLNLQKNPVNNQQYQ